MLRFALPDPRCRSAATAVFCALLVLLPGVCNATVSVFGGHEAGGARFEHGGVDVPSHHDAMPIARVHSGGDASVPSSGHIPDQGEGHCESHACCMTAVKGPARLLGVVAPRTTVSFESNDAPLLLQSSCVSSADLGSEAPPGTPGLTAISAPLRR